jgi:hypothetical protein
VLSAIFAMYALSNENHILDSNSASVL